MTTFNHHNTIVNPRHPYAGKFNLDILLAADWTIEQLIDIEYLIPLDKIKAYFDEELTNPRVRDYVNDKISHYEYLQANNKVTSTGKVEMLTAKYLDKYLDRPGSQYRQPTPTPETDNLFEALRKAGDEAKLAADKLTGCADKLASCTDNISKQMLGRIRRFPHDELADYAFEQKKVDSLVQDRTNKFNPRRVLISNAPINNELLNDDRISELLNKLWHFTPLGSSVKRHNPDPFTEPHWFKGCGYRLKVRPTVLALGERIHVVIDDDVFSNYELSVVYKELGFNQ